MQTPDPNPSPLRRARVVTSLALWLLAAPALQALALAGLPVLNFSPGHVWNYLAYGLAAPWVGILLWRRHPRARFAAYVFLTLETGRGVHLRRRSGGGLGRDQTGWERRYLSRIGTLTDQQCPTFCC